MFADKNPIKILNVFLALGLFGWMIGGVSSLAWSAEAKVGFVNIQEAMFGTKEYKRASASFKSDFERGELLSADHWKISGIVARRGEIFRRLQRIDHSCF